MDILMARYFVIPASMLYVVSRKIGDGAPVSFRRTSCSTSCAIVGPSSSSQL
jgi:hypothetical protein